MRSPSRPKTSGGPTAPLLRRPIQVEDFMRNPVWVWDLPFAPMTLSETVNAVSALVESRRPSFFITANTHYAMLTKKHPDLHAVNTRAAFLVADGAPLVWASRWQGMPLPERVAGSDLIFDLCVRAAERKCRVFLLGGATGIAEEAARRLCRRYPELHIVGIESPPFAPHRRGARRAGGQDPRARPDILFVAFGQPKGEFWIADHLQALGVPVCVQVGASLDFVAGQVRRAPRVLQRLGLNGPIGCGESRDAWDPVMLAMRGSFSAWSPATCSAASDYESRSSRRRRSSRARLTLQTQDLKGTTIPRVP